MSGRRIDVVVVEGKQQKCGGSGGGGGGKQWKRGGGGGGSGGVGKTIEMWWWWKENGKTAWVRSLLQRASETIYPTPERIIWCYSQWQPAYTEMLVAMPHIEFVKKMSGIPILM